MLSAAASDSRRRQLAPLGLALITTVVVLLMGLIPSGNAQANGDTSEFFRGREGQYEIILSILPELPQVGTVHFSITPLDASTSQPVTEAVVTIVANNPKGEPAFRARALNTPATPSYYDANITFNRLGAWTLTLRVESESLGVATITIPFEVAEQGVIPNRAGGIVFLVLFVVIISGGIYVWYSATRRRRKASA